MTKFSEDVTKEQIAGVIDWILEDMENERKSARAAYEKDSSDEFHGYMDTMYGFAGDMIRARLSTLCDDKQDDSTKKEPTATEQMPPA